MKDQIESLRKLQIKAVAVHSGCTREEAETALNNCLYGGYKFLYVSPERLGNELFRIRFKEMPVNLIAVDEAHCVSQWGYDFRPSYLKIADLRPVHPQVPILALTATATATVVDDIQDKLQFRQRNLLKTSFSRQNLVYAVRYSENKDRDVVDIIKKLRGQGIVYVRSRRKSTEIARYLSQEGISATYYHAGLDHVKRNEVQQNWMIGKTRVIVATSAFGMGIDKPDVRFVLHADLPDSPEAYFQEAGRAGRDGSKAYAILLSSPADEMTVQRRIQINFPEIATVKEVYAALANYLQVPLGAGKGISYDFSGSDFVRISKLSAPVAYSALRLLTMEGYIELSEEINSPSRIKFLMTRDDLYKFQVSNPLFDTFIKLILRSYTGVFTEYAAIDEEMLARRANVGQDVVHQYLGKLSALGVINYIPRKRTPMIIFTEERLGEKSLYIHRDMYLSRKDRFTERASTMLKYALSADTCRSQLLLSYFGEPGSTPCGECDVCKGRNSDRQGGQEWSELLLQIQKIIADKPVALDDVINETSASRDKVMGALQWLLDEDIVRFDTNRLLILSHKRHPASRAKGLGGNS
jgi:ATP-dependent DNA helicase RecQ